ncbi:hypothetical protein NDI54_02970 [Haloarcula sp. S1AR25-5A]|uniref:DUF3806 domain-containing protein n=1 Tax=Haloarcula terrestris TaxID=2950533 RepID=A0AAE4EW23_9EURY|nr:hypothetical protein [Haloarcula terrestris]MDS0220307.1 hypothetical protein [Haloarcula terrestris]
MGLFDTIRRAVGGDASSTDGDEQAAGDDRPSDDGPELLDTATLDPETFREYAERVVEGADPLTFDPDALARLDTAIEESYDGKTAGDDADVTTYTENTVRFGSYLGELLVRAYDGEWVQSDGRWGVAVAGPDDEVGVAVFDVAARSFGGEPVFAAVVTRLESDLALDTVQESDGDDQAGPDREMETDETDADSAVSEPTRVVRRVDDGQADEPADASEPTATDEQAEAATTDTDASEPSQDIETEPTRVVRRVEPESDGDDRPEDTAPTPVVSRVTEDEMPSADGSDAESDGDADPDTVGSAADDIEPSGAETAGEESTGDSDDAETAEQSPDDTAGEESPGVAPATESAADVSDDESAANAADAAEPTADETAETATDDDGATETDDPERALEGVTADPSDAAPAPETPPEEPADGFRGEDRAIDTTAGEATTDTADDGAAEEPADDESALAGSPAESSTEVPDSDLEPAAETDGADSATDTRDAARTADATEPDNAPAAVDTAEAASDTEEPSAGDSAAPSPTDDSAMPDSSEQPAPPDTGDETAATVTPDDSERSDPPGGDSTGQSWDPGTTRAEHAETAVEFADFWGEHGLDFSPASLSRLDDLVDAEWDDERFAETTFGSDDSFDDRAFTSVVRELGGYFGEVLVRQLGGEWTDETDHEAAVIVGGPAGQFAVPVFDVAITSLRKQAVFGRSYDALLGDLGRDGPTR